MENFFTVRTVQKLYNSVEINTVIIKSKPPHFLQTSMHRQQTTTGLAKRSWGPRTPI